MTGRNGTYSVTADAIVIAGPNEAPSILLVLRDRPPHEGCWALPGGFLEGSEKLITCAVRECREETGVILDPQTGVLVGVYDDPDRDPRGRIITVAFAFRLTAFPKPQGGDDAREARFFRIDEVPSLAFDHDCILADSLDRS